MKTKLFLFVTLLFMLIGFNIPQTTSALGVVSPLEESGLVPLWSENFTNGSIERLQYGWTKRDNNALTSFVMPNAVYLGKQGGTDLVEQQINNFKASPDELLPSTIEFDVFNPYLGDGRVSLRPRRRGDMVSLDLGLAKSKTKVNFKQNSVKVTFSERTGPDYGWAHVVLSYQQYLVGSTLYARYVLAINNEIKEHTGPSGLTSPDWQTYWNTDPTADGWSIEHASSLALMGKYIANVRVYSEFLSKDDLTQRLAERVTPYRAGLSDPRTYSGPTKPFQVHKVLTLRGPNAMAYATLGDNSIIEFDGSLSSAEEKITSYHWTFGDGQTGDGRLVSHMYALPGVYSVVLTATSVAGTDTHTITVTVP